MGMRMRTGMGEVGLIGAALSALFVGKRTSGLAFEQRLAVTRGELAPGPGYGVMTRPHMKLPGGGIGADQIRLPGVGTLGCVRHSGPVGWAVATGTRSPWSHTVMYVGEVDGGGVKGPAVLEAKSDGAVVTPLSRIIADIASGDIAHFGWALDMPEFAEASSGSEGWLKEDDLRAQVAQIGLAMIGTPYSWAGIVAIGLLQFGVKIPWATKYVRRLDEAFCSQLYAVACMGAGVDVGQGRPDGIWGISPGDLARGRRLWDIHGRPLKYGH